MSADTATITGRRLLQARKRLGWSQGDLSRRSGVSRSYVTEIERGVKKPSARVATILANTLGVELDELMS